VILFWSAVSYQQQRARRVAGRAPGGNDLPGEIAQGRIERNIPT